MPVCCSNSPWYLSSALATGLLLARKVKVLPWCFFQLKSWAPVAPAHKIATTAPRACRLVQRKALLISVSCRDVTVYKIIPSMACSVNLDQSLKAIIDIGDFPGFRHWMAMYRLL